MIEIMIDDIGAMRRADDGKLVKLIYLWEPETLIARLFHPKKDSDLVRQYIAKKLTKDELDEFPEAQGNAFWLGKAKYINTEEKLGEYHYFSCPIQFYKVGLRNLNL